MASIASCAAIEAADRVEVADAEQIEAEPRAPTAFPVDGPDQRREGEERDDAATPACRAAR